MQGIIIPHHVLMSMILSLSLPSHALWHVHLNQILILKSSSKARDSMSEFSMYFAEMMTLFRAARLTT